MLLNLVLHCLHEARKQLNSIPQRTHNTYPDKEHIHKYSTTDCPALNDFHLNRSEKRWFLKRSWLNKERCNSDEAIQPRVIYDPCMMIKSLICWPRCGKLARNCQSVINRWLKHVFFCWPFQAFLRLPTVLKPKRNTTVLSTSAWSIFQHFGDVATWQTSRSFCKKAYLVLGLRVTTNNLERNLC